MATVSSGARELELSDGVPPANAAAVAAVSNGVLPANAAAVAMDEEDPSKAEGYSDSDASGADAAKGEPRERPPQRLMLLVMISIIQGYTLIGPLQHAFKVEMSIADTGNVAKVFTQAVAFVQYGKFAMTLGQNFLLAWLTPLQRVYLAMSLMFCGCLIPPVFAYLLHTSWIGIVFLCYGLIGISLGIFECTFLNVITPLGPLTKSWAIMGFPAAFAVINVVGFGLVSFGMPVQVLFWWVVFWIPVGVLLFRSLKPEEFAAAQGAGSQDPEHAPAARGQASVWRSLVQWREWLVQLGPFMLANAVGHFVMEGALPANFNAYNAAYVPLFGPKEVTHLMEKHRYFVIFFVFVGVGDMMSRRVGYCFKLETYAANMGALTFGLLCCLLGMHLTTLGVAVVGWLSVFLSFWGQGFNYAVATKFIDRYIPPEHNLAAYSVWIFAAGAGGLFGASMVDVIRGWICTGHTYQYECLAHGH